MRKLEMKALELTKQTLSREQMKDVRGGELHVVQPCYRCCPDDPCLPPHTYCLDVLCPVLS
ncbi:MAG TPA: hypothetical protein VM802_24125 [Chitinophaga sp.]|uniref:hypothetical protein n=1 Tax=Chitinophaga sp. TaxID=1869181 RepID=UPI002C9384E3|nr:hypothetical protein [Chitinophaga sp.]HVI47977.1 hypothetical protein [Chitinophaga sp.]